MSQNRQSHTQRQSGSPTAAIGVPDQYQPSEQTRQQYFPELDEDDWRPIAEAPGFENTMEQRSFDTQYNLVANHYYMEAIATPGLEGNQVLSMFHRWKPVVRNFVLSSLRNDSVDNRLGATLSSDPNGSGQAYLRPLRLDSAPSGNVSYEQTPAATGQFNIYPNETAGDGVMETPDSNEQAWIIFGMYEYAGAGSIPYDTIQANLDDATGVRQEVYCRPQLETGTIPIVEFTRGPLPAYPNVGVDIDIDVYRTGIQTQLWPIGYEVIVESAAESGGVLGL